MANHLIAKRFDVAFHPHHAERNRRMVRIRKDDEFTVYSGMQKAAKPVKRRKEAMLQKHFSILSD